MKTEHANHQGFTLIEVLVAIVIMAIGILSVITMQLTSIGGNLNANNISVASGWAADRIEQIFSMDYEDPDLNDDDGNGAAGLNTTDGSADGTADSPDGFYTIYWNVIDDKNPSDLKMPNTKTIRIIVIRKDCPILCFLV